jgi:hypothetical protein
MLPNVSAHARSEKPRRRDVESRITFLQELRAIVGVIAPGRIIA